jgi:hypothetical protein
VKKDQKMAVVSPFVHAFLVLQLKTNAAISSLISKLQRGSAMLTRRRSLRSAMRMVVVAKRIVKRRLNGTAQL